ncbi:hypothetical protein WDW37_12020 [Bdellovibrionota bacterium FG-1]
MTYLLIFFMLAMTLPLFVSSWRIALTGVGIQALLLGLILLRSDERSPSALLQAIDLIVVRGALIPLYLMVIVRKFLPKDQSLDLIPPNLILWTGAITLINLGFWFGQFVFPNDLSNLLFLGTASAAVLIGLFILSNQKIPIGQVIGILVLEAGIVLFELMTNHPLDLPAQAAVSLIFLLLTLVFGLFLKRFPAIEKQEQSNTWVAEEREVL